MRVFIRNSDHFQPHWFDTFVNGRQEEPHKVKLSPISEVEPYLDKHRSVDRALVLNCSWRLFVALLQLSDWKQGQKWLSLSCKCESFLSCSAWSLLQCAVSLFVFTSRPKRQSKPSDDGYWDCSVCTFKNSAEAFKCLMCDVRKGTSTR